ncbi:DUF2391 family protein [Halarcobacter sp.]|uniref:DUF2391 family protein n=1 Tax=Halarcobacter sp. TaxID=2321133 RepID=UPI002AA9086D|nr:DUF2391 family protein [Halarcobacter sp.]
MSKDLRFNLEDVSQIIIGSFALAIPISFSEEAWRLSETLPFFNLGLLLILSFCFLGFYTFQGIFQGNVKSRLFAFIFRVFIAYLIAMVVVFLILLAIDKLPLIDETIIAIKRIIVISMPASMGAIIVDGFDKE